MLILQAKMEQLGEKEKKLFKSLHKLKPCKMYVFVSVFKSDNTMLLSS